MIIKSTNGDRVGETLTAKRFVGKPKHPTKGWFWGHDNLWEVDKTFTSLSSGSVHNLSPEHWLMRIDGHKEETKTKEKRLSNA